MRIRMHGVSVHNQLVTCPQHRRLLRVSWSGSAGCHPVVQWLVHPDHRQVRSLGPLEPAFLTEGTGSRLFD